MSAKSRPIFEIYVDDDRYAVPTLHLVLADDEVMVREIAGRLLSENAHHRGAEICLGGRLLFGVGTFASRPRLGPAGPASEANATT